MLPLKDDNPTQRRPFVTVALMGLNLAVYLYQLTLGPQENAVFMVQYGAVPAWILGPTPMGVPPDWIPRTLTLVTAMFVHGGIFHLCGNMLYLWIFGNNIEDALGPVRYLAFYLAGGVVASLAYVVTSLGSQVPMVGASGAIAAILGAYLVLFPRAMILVFAVVTVVRVPALVLLVIWFMMQVIGVDSSPGVAWMAHLGGFLAGILMVRYFLPKPKVLH